MSVSPTPTHSHRPHHPPPGKHLQAPDLGNDQERKNYIIDTFIRNFGESMRENPKGWRRRFRKMAADEFAFFRGSAVLFYRDLQNNLHRDPWLRNCEKASKMFIHVSVFYLRRNKKINFIFY